MIESRVEDAKKRGEERDAIQMRAVKGRIFPSQGLGE